MPVAILVFLLSMIVLQVSVLSGVRLQLDEDLLALQYEQLGDVSRDEIAAGGVLLLQVSAVFLKQPLAREHRTTLVTTSLRTSPLDRILLLLIQLPCPLCQVFLWISRPYLLEPIVGPGLNDAATACGSCVLMFVIPSVKRPGEALLTWSVAQQHLPWGILLLLGAGFALADGCEASGLTLVLGRHLAEVSHLFAFFFVLLLTLLNYVGCHMEPTQRIHLHPLKHITSVRSKTGGQRP